MRGPTLSGMLLKSLVLRAVLPFAVCLLLAGPAPGQTAAAASEPAKKSLRELLIDDEDGWLDLSEMMFSSSNSRYRFLPIPIPILITEPAVGYGLGLAPVWFHKPPDRSSGQLVPPSVSMAAAFATTDGSWGGGGGHFHSFKNDTWRVLGFAGYASLELESAGISTDFAAGQTLEYSIASTFLLLQASRKMSARTLSGLRYIYAQSDIELEGPDPSTDRSLAGDSTIGGLAVFVEFDSRDSVISPAKGHRFELRPGYYGELFGSDVEYVQVESSYTGYWHRGPLGFALRVEADWIDDGAPFYVKPFISLRGLPAMAYLGEEVFSAEPEIGWKVHPRWTLLAFAGAGRARNDFGPLGETRRDVHTGGAGFRYLLSRELGLQAGFDFAVSSEGDHALYIVVGNPWR